MKLHRFAPLWVAALVFAAYATLSRGSMGAGSRLVDALALWLPLGDAALRSRLALALVAAITAWAVAKIVSSSAMPASSGSAVTSDGAVGAIAGVVSAVLLVGAPTYWLAGAAGAVAVGAALVAISGCRRVAGAGAEVPAREALGAALAVVVAAALEPGYGALAGPALLLWWSSVGRRRGDLRGRREVRVAALGVTPALLLAAAALWLRGVLASSAVAAAGAAAGPGAASSPLAAAQALAERLGPTAVVAAIAGVLALALSARKEEAASAATSLAARAWSPADRWLAGCLTALAVGGLVVDGRRHQLGVPALLAAALAAGFAIQRLGAMVSSAPALGFASASASASASSSPAPVAALLAAPGAAGPAPRVLLAGAGLLAFAAGFLVLVPSLL